MDVTAQAGQVQICHQQSKYRISIQMKRRHTSRAPAPGGSGGDSPPPPGAPERAGAQENMTAILTGRRGRNSSITRYQIYRLFKA